MLAAHSLGDGSLFKLPPKVRLPVPPFPSLSPCPLTGLAIFCLLMSSRMPTLQLVVSKSTCLLALRLFVSFHFKLPYFHSLTTLTICLPFHPYSTFSILIGR